MQKRRLSIWALIATALITSASAVEVQRSRLNHSQINQVDSMQSEQRRLLWDLSEQEWARYKTLMQGIRGSISPATVSPLEVLAMHAETDQKRRHYARLWAKRYHDDVERTLKFQAAYNEAWDELYGNQPLIDISKLNLKRPQPEPWKEGDRIALFIKIQHCARCQNAVNQAAKRVLKVGATLDLYFVATQSGRDDDLIRLWAQAASINPKDVKQKRITLNHEDGELMRFTGTVVTQFPLAYLIRPNSIQATSVDQLK